MKIALINCNIIVGDKNNEIIRNKTIYIDNEKIVGIIDSSKSLDRDYKVMDMNSRFVMPGLINMHVHLFGSGKPSKVLGGGKLQKFLINLVKTKLGNKILDKMVKNHVLTQLQSGVTTIRSVGDFFYSDVRIRDRIKEGKIQGPRLIVSGPAITVPDGHGAGTFAMTSNTIEGLKELVRLNQKHNVDFIKICTTGGVMDAKKLGEPGEVKMTVEQTKAICDEAHHLGMKVASHVESSEGVLVALSGGVDSIEHGSELNEETIALFKKHNSVFISTISPALPLAKLDYKKTKLTSFSQYNSNIVFENMLKCAKTVQKEDIPMGMGTDASCPFVTQYNTWKELVYTKNLLNLSNSEVIYLSTLSNATILGLDKEIGTIEVGKIADLLVLNENPLENLNTLKDPYKVMTQGSFITKKKIKHNKLVDSILEKI